MNVMITGAGEIGFQLARRLSMEKYDITLVEQDPAKCRHARENLDAIVLEGSGSSAKTLIEAGIENTDIFAAMTNVDEANIFACQIAKKFGCKSTIARVRSHEFLKDDYVFSKKELGADYIIQPELTTARSIARLVRQSSATDLIEFDDGKIKMIGLRLDKDSDVIHTQLKDFGLKYGNPPINICAIKRRQHTIIPRGDDLILEGDQIFIISHPDFLDEALAIFGKHDTKIEDIMIIGGGLVGQFLAQELEKDIDVKIIEKDSEKSVALADKLPKSLVINGDGSDLDLLLFEGLTDMDEFIAVTGDDETNIITSLLANHMEVPRTITLVSKKEYLSLAPSIGIESVISKQLITVNAVQKFIRRSKIAFFAEIPGVDAEIVEFIASEGTKIVRKPLRKIHFPEGAVIGAVLKDQEDLIIPKGNTQISPGDRVIVFSLPENIRSVEKIFGA